MITLVHTHEQEYKTNMNLYKLPGMSALWARVGSVFSGSHLTSRISRLPSCSVQGAQKVGGKQSIETEIKVIEKCTHECPIPDQDQPIFSAAHPRVLGISTSKDPRTTDHRILLVYLTS